MTKTLKPSRRRLQVIRERASATRFTASLKRGRALATHAIAAGVESTETVEGVANGLRSVAKRLGMKPVKVVRRHRTVRGKEKRTKVTYHFTTAQVGVLLRNYKPRRADVKAAVVLMVLANGAPVTVRQAVRPARKLVNA
ncbi:hypothetical protein [Streptomyces sp. S1D4-14]|uniref:hypothetical protein n=1 Tax=Streptomyces sp. S1D4-14 TaxID=2594461 RepID=UPI001164DC9B|nr:hypothetical protein [Streptomyces sp. S1D4-14]QDN64487.1 hypothetical protein FNV66_01240 [Streptomyces sp. S1D4-14]